MCLLVQGRLPLPQAALPVWWQQSRLHSFIMHMLQHLQVLSNVIISPHTHMLQELRQANKTLAERQTQIEQLEQLEASTASEAAAHARQCEDSKARIADLDGQLCSSRHRCNELSSQLASADAQRTQLQESLSQAEAQVCRTSGPQILRLCCFVLFLVLLGRSSRLKVNHLKTV